MSKATQLKTTRAVVIAAIFILAMLCPGQHRSSQAGPNPANPLPTGLVTRATLTANVPQSHGCPVNVTFQGTIHVSGPVTVRYTWVSFDGGTWPEHTIRFSKPGFENVSEQREVFATGTGWLQLKVTSPTTLLSDRASYKVTCLRKIEK
jgi:hypothetical protein